MADLNLIASIGNSIQAKQIQGTQLTRSSVVSIDNAAESVSFADILKNTLDHVNQAQQRATELTREFQLGNPKVTLEESMIAGQIAALQLQTVVQVRNKLTDAYQSIMNMPV